MNKSVQMNPGDVSSPAVVPAFCSFYFLSFKTEIKIIYLNLKVVNLGHGSTKRRAALAAAPSRPDAEPVEPGTGVAGEACAGAEMIPPLGAASPGINLWEYSIIMTANVTGDRTITHAGPECISAAAILISNCLSPLRRAAKAAIASSQSRTTPHPHPPPPSKAPPLHLSQEGNTVISLLG